MKRIVTVQDISCVGKCSLTVALPLISAMGIECAILPTAVLSTHTMFSGFTCRDLSDQIEPIAEHWAAEQLGFSAVYTGYLGSFEQIDQMKALFAQFKTPDTLLFVDPAMADNGRLYPAFDEAFARHMATLCARADVIVPNITEACYMTGTDYREQYDGEYVMDLLEKLSGLCSGTCILTGVSLTPGMTGVMGRYPDGRCFRYEHEKLPVSYHGTGDIFSSVCLGALCRGLSPEQAVELAADYTVECIRLTLADPDRPWYGVNFEQAIPWLLARLN